ncbi:hypothetical protein IFT90_03660 [Frigoribacterium sp. CFBP 8766]|uniref:hypothetical protein n=1 Tax=Frigoribacterium sp. CFBP 8766 TaxID=2775273 RepID=UPI00177E982D|nr:hypothetical protein [Frigoribacterium sp. CFBP 8766]MBD8583651.1 hypothetical protein [Frigoribacterium sp. CFBP 8766]
MRTRGGLWAATAVLVATMTVAGCASGAAPGEAGDGDATPRATATAAASTPAPAEATATPAPAPDALASVDTIVVTAAGLSLRQGEVELASLDVVALPLDEAVALLTRALGEPREAGVEEDHCQPAQTRWGWGEGTYLGTPDLYTDEGTLTFTTKDTSIETDDGRSVRLQTPGGIAVGDPIAPLAEATDPAYTDDFSADPSREVLSLVYDLVRADEVSGDEISPYGASVHSIDGLVTAILGPSTLKDYC